MSFEATMDATRDYCTKCSKSEKKKGKHHMISLICRILHMTQMNVSMKKKQAHRFREEICDCQGGGALRQGRIGSSGLAGYIYIYIYCYIYNG